MIINSQLKKLTAATLVTASLLSGCTTIDPITGQERVSNAGVGATIGALGGAIVGSAIGKTDGAVIGAGLGALAGGAIGHGMDRQEVLLRRALNNSGVQVTRSGEDIRLIMPGDITFANDSANINPRFYRTLNKVADVLYDFPDTELQVAGFTSSTGTRHHNQILSKQRARNVAKYLTAQDINPDRIYAVGYGRRFPIADNNTRRGRALNRRVEITIHPIG